MNFLTDPQGKEITPTNPLPVGEVNFAREREAVTGETVAFVTGAAGFTGKVSLDKAPLANLTGDKVGSHWRKNPLLSNSVTSYVTAVVETATSATVTVFDTDRNLEQIFETPSGVAKAVIELTDPSGGTLYGYIGGVSASGNAYTLSVYNTAALATQSWVGTLSGFAFAAGTRFTVYSNETSLAWTTGTVLTREVELPDGFGEVNFLDGLSNGDYGVDYERGTIYYKKATTGTSDTAAYSVLKQYETATISGTVTVDSEFPAAAAASDNFANPTTTDVMAMGMVYDGSAWDRQKGDSTDGTLVNLGTNNDVTVTSGAITETNSGTISTNVATVAGDTTSIDGKITACDTGAVVVASGAITETNSGTIAGDTTSIDGKITACDTGAVVVASGAITETNSGSIKTAVELIDDAIYTGGSGTASKGVLIQANDGTNPQNLLCDANKYLKGAEQYMPQAEDNTNGVYAMQNKPLAASTYCWSVDASAALEASSVTKGSAGNIRKFSGRIDSSAASATYYLQLLNASSLPADGAVSFICAPTKIQHVTGTDSPINLDFTDNCINASTGIVWCLSSTEFTKTISGAYVSATVMFK